MTIPATFYMSDVTPKEKHRVSMNITPDYYPIIFHKIIFYWWFTSVGPGRPTNSVCRWMTSSLWCSLLLRSHDLLGVWVCDRMSKLLLGTNLRTYDKKNCRYLKLILLKNISFFVHMYCNHYIDIMKRYCNWMYAYAWILRRVTLCHVKHRVLLILYIDLGVIWYLFLIFCLYYQWSYLVW